MKLLLQERDGDLVSVACEGDMTLLPAAGQADALREVIGPDCFKHQVLFNMARTDYVDSSGISWLVVIHGKFREGGGRLAIHSVPPRIQETFALLRLSTILHLTHDEASARGLVTSAIP